MASVTNRQIQFVISMKNMAQAALSQFSQGMAGAGSASASASTQMNNAAASAGKLNAAMKQGAGNAAQLKAHAAAAGQANSVMKELTTSVLAFVSAHEALKAVEVYTEFEKQMSRFKATADASVDTVNKVTDAAREMGRTSQFSATQAAEAMTMFVKMGQSAEMAAKNATSALNLAVIAGESLEHTVEVASGVINEFNLKAEDTAKVIDVLAQVSAHSRASVSDLGTAFSYVGTLANTLGVNFNELSATFEVLSMHGIKASSMGTDMQAIFAGMATPSKAAQSAIERLGLSMNDLDPTHIADSFKKLKDAGAGFAELTAIFGERGARAGAALLAYAGEVDKARVATESAGGSAEKMAKIMGDNLAGDFKKLQNNAEDLSIALGDTGVGKGLRDIVQGVTSAIQNIDRFVTSMNGTTEAGQRFGKIAEVVIVAAGSFGTITAAIFIAKEALELLTAAALENPFTALLAAASIAIGVLYTFRDSTIGVGDSTVQVRDLVMAAWEMIKGAISSVGDYFNSVAESSGTSMGSVMDAVGTGIKWIINTFVNFFAVLVNLWIEEGKTIYDVVTNLCKGISDKFAGLGQSIYDATHGNFGKIGEDLGDVFGKGIELGVGDHINNLKNIITEGFSNDRLGDLGKQLMNGAADQKRIRETREATEKLNQAGANPSPVNKSGGGTDTSLANPNTFTRADPQAAQEQKVQEFIDKATRSWQTQTSEIGKSADEVARMNAELKIKEELEKEGIKNGQKYVDEYMAQYDALQKAKQAYESNPMNGLSQAVNKFATDNSKFADATAKVWETTFDGIADNMADMVTKGTSDWKGLLANIESMMVKSSIKYLMSQLMGGLFGAAEAVVEAEEVARSVVSSAACSAVEAAVEVALAAGRPRVVARRAAAASSAASAPTSRAAASSDT